MILPSSHSPSVIKPSQAMRAADREPAAAEKLMRSICVDRPPCSRVPRGIEDKYRIPDSSKA